MAQPVNIYRAAVQLSDVDCGVYETLTATLARHPSETAERLVLRLLAYALCYEPELTFTKGVAAGDDPDLWVKGPDGRVTLWVEVGTPDPERLIKAARHSERVVLLAGGANRFRWDDQYLPRLTGIPNLRVIGVGSAFISRLADGLERNIVWEMTRSDGVIYLTVGGETLETTVELMAGSVSQI